MCTASSFVRAVQCDAPCIPLGSLCNILSVFYGTLPTAGKQSIFLMEVPNTYIIVGGKKRVLQHSLLHLTGAVYLMTRRSSSLPDLRCAVSCLRSCSGAATNVARGIAGPADTRPSGGTSRRSSGVGKTVAPGTRPPALLQRQRVTSMSYSGVAPTAVLGTRRLVHVLL